MWHTYWHKHKKEYFCFLVLMLMLHDDNIRRMCEFVLVMRYTYIYMPSEINTPAFIMYNRASYIFSSNNFLSDGERKENPLGLYT